jgi:hypothetical protein
LSFAGSTSKAAVDPLNLTRIVYMVYLRVILVVVWVIYGPHLWARYIMNRYNQREYFSG